MIEAAWHFKKLIIVEQTKEGKQNIVSALQPRTAKQKNVANLMRPATLYIVIKFIFYS